LRERWFGATGRKVADIVLEGQLDLDDALVLEAWDGNAEAAHAAFASGRPVVVRARGADEVKDALSHPEVACALVTDPALLDLDLVKMTYGS
jgi:hypothetical protein